MFTWWMHGDVLWCIDTHMGMTQTHGDVHLLVLSSTDLVHTTHTHIHTHSLSLTHTHTHISITLPTQKTGVGVSRAVQVMGYPAE